MDALVQKAVSIYHNFTGSRSGVSREGSARLLEDQESPDPYLEKLTLSHRSRPWSRLCHRSKETLLSLLILLKPRFPSKAEHGKLRSTAWLDGVRGVAALLVVFQHMEVAWFWEFLHSVRGGPSIDPVENWFVWLLMQRPLALLWMGGPNWVNIFFVVSGYSLSYKPLSLLAAGSAANCRETLTSSTFRRPIRLYMPIVASTFITMICTHLGWWHDDLPWWTKPAPRLNSFYEQMKHWASSLSMLFDPFRNPEQPLIYPYDANLWTIPKELFGSMVVFMLLLALADTRRPVRYVAAVSFSALCFRAGYDVAAIFTSGLVLAETHLLFSKYQSTKARSRQVTSHKYSCIIVALSTNVFWMSTFTASLWIAGSEATTTPFQQIWVTTAPTTTVLAVNYSTLLQKFFTTRISMFLARISYSLYLIHGPVIRILGTHVAPLFMALFGAEVHDDVNRFDGRKDGRYVVAIACTAVVVLAFCFWLADLFERFVDLQSVRFAQWGFATLKVKNTDEEVGEGRLG